MGIIDYELIVMKLKAAMKSRKITYAQLAENLQMSESGIKKVFAAKDCAIGKLAHICSALEISLVDLIEAEVDRKTGTISFSNYQQNAFLENPLLFKIYWALTYEGVTLNEIKSKWGLEKVIVIQSLRRLDKLNLLKWGPGDRIQLMANDLPYWQDSGPFVEKTKREWSRRLLEEALHKNKSSEQIRFSLRCFFLTESSREEFQKSLKELITEFDRRTHREIKLHGHKALKASRFVSVLGDGSFILKS